MATYKGIQGVPVQTLASDPTPTENFVGQLWYNSTSGTFKIATEGAGAWTSANSLSGTGRQQSDMVGNKTAAIIMGGDYTWPHTYPTWSETYDGTSWTEGNDINEGRINAAACGAGVPACLYIGGTDSPAGQIASVEQYNGTCWSEVNDLNDSRRAGTAAGTVTAALLAGGSSPGSTNSVEYYDGTSWTEGNNLQSPNEAGQGTGIQTAAFVTGGNPPATRTEIYNGTSWSNANSMQNEKTSGAAAGTTTSGLVFGGYDSSSPAPTDTGQTESYDGTSWTEVGDMGTARTGVAGAGPSNQAAIVASGYTTVYLALCEEWTSPLYVVKTVTTS